MGEQIPFFFLRPAGVGHLDPYTAWSAIGCRTPIAELLPVVAA
jgi:hypothetical protein